ncbi:GNAT family N-acetyltransferase [Methanobrevibacter sp. TMH8]|uniref:GNAT family N-acetyltransferase n=1 Tax=Methanobrevibacter sp. TMH8 TaxID=2848611 RepID=UPI001CC958DD|nr:GNAT family N-acetyltransferase [Methanobrevibacter sp. TMH8]MBZ9571526.1 GNAT family N-acetyltransferase [Methanobrevibacter sp. TMH8]
MKILKIKENKKEFLDLLLLADEEEEMIDKYLEDGELFTLYDDDLKSLCVLTSLKDSYELKNIATYPQYQNQGYGQKLIEFIIDYCKCKNKFKSIYVGTGDCEKIINFYEKCGFEKSHKISNFFVDNYKKPIFEDDKQLIDMIYLKRDLY